MRAATLIPYFGLILFSAAVRSDVLQTTNIDITATPQSTTLRFCYEDKQLLPYYTGNGQGIPDMPGATIEHLRLAATKVGIALQLVRLPWLRCLQQLEDNSVDALVAAYDESRAHYTRFPAKPDGTADPARAINQLGLCLAYRYDNPLPDKLAAKKEITVSRPLGYRPIPFPDLTILIPAHSAAQALELVISGRVDATTVLCQLNGVNTQEQQISRIPVVLLYPPLYQSDGYLMLSQRFYQHYPDLAENLWQALPQTLNKANYTDYMRYPD